MTRFLRRALCAVAASALFPAISTGQRGAPTGAPRAAPPAEWPSYLSAFDAYIHADSIVGAATLVMRDGRVLAHHETGFADRALGQRVDTNTIFHWGSITKTLTAIAVMQLVERGRLSLDARVTDYIPELRRVHDAWGSMDSVTVQMLLSHASGLQNGTWPWTKGRPWEPFEPTTWEQLVAMMPYQEVAFKPGTRYSYSNPGFIYLARIVQHLTGDPWEAYVQKNIFTPLGLTRSYFNATPWHLAEYRSNNYYVERDSAAAACAWWPTAASSIRGSRCRTAGGTRRSATSRPTWRSSPMRRAATRSRSARTKRSCRTRRSNACGSRAIRPIRPTRRASGRRRRSSCTATGDATIVGHTGQPGRLPRVRVLESRDEGRGDRGVQHLERGGSIRVDQGFRRVATRCMDASPLSVAAMIDPRRRYRGGATNRRDARSYPCASASTRASSPGSPTIDTLSAGIPSVPNPAGTETSGSPSQFP